MFDWQAFLDEYRIEYVTKGPNVSKGNINIRCPWCGSDDHSHHMGISLNGEGYGCWRSRQHRGKSPIRLIQALIGCSKEQAKRIVGYSGYVPENLMDQVLANLEELEPNFRPSNLKLPEEFKPFIENKPSAKMFIRYLLNRGFTEKQIFTFTDRYGLRYCTRGPYRGRIIFPVYFKRKLVSWTGRTVYPGEELRYKSLTVKEDKAEIEGYGVAEKPIGDYILWYDELMKKGGRIICLVEGPFDALKVRVLGRKLGVYATCFFTTQPSRNQIDLLHELLPKFERKIILPDAGAFHAALDTQAELSGLSVEIGDMPHDIEDPGELTAEMLWKIIA